MNKQTKTIQDSISIVKDWLMGVSSEELIDIIIDEMKTKDLIVWAEEIEDLKTIGK